MSYMSLIQTSFSELCKEKRIDRAFISLLTTIQSVPPSSGSGGENVCPLFQTVDKWGMKEVKNMAIALALHISSFQPGFQTHGEV